MNELDLQRLVVQSVKMNGGTGWKMSNKFLVGIPDLILCLPGQGIGVWEVKQTMMPKTVEHVILKPTALQEKVLNDVTEAGGFCGIISFIRGRRELYCGVYLYKTLRYADEFIKKHQIAISSHEPLPRGEREGKIVDLITRAWSWHNA